MATRTASRRCIREFRTPTGSRGYSPATVVSQAEDGGEETAFDPYAAENPGEFFAVMSEAFFETPDVLQAEYPALYENLVGFYRQDPASRLLPPGVVQ